MFNLVKLLLVTFVATIAVSWLAQSNLPFIVWGGLALVSLVSFHHITSAKKKADLCPHCCEMEIDEGTRAFFHNWIASCPDKVFAENVEEAFEEVVTVNDLLSFGEKALFMEDLYRMQNGLIGQIVAKMAFQCACSLVSHTRCHKRIDRRHIEIIDRLAMW